MSTVQLKLLSITINDTIILKFSHIPNIRKGDLLCIKGKYFPLQCKEIYLDQCHALNSYDIFVPIGDISKHFYTINDTAEHLITCMANDYWIVPNKEEYDKIIQNNT